MKPADMEALVAHRLQRSEEALQAAKIMMDKQMFSFAMNRVYYPLYYAIQALLARQGVTFAKHGQVKGYFNREFIKPGKLSKEIGRFYTLQWHFGE
jgi:uncharacterized protein (UPF0332 family)